MRAGAEALAAALGPGIDAGFSTRGGGCSSGPWRGLNLGANVGDDRVRVARNRGLLAGVAGAPVVFARQVHGTAVADADALGARTLDAGLADAIVTTRSDIALGVLVADCVPVVLADAAAGVVAVAHAGRRGLVAGVLEAALDAMAGRGATQVAAAVGPCVCGSCYEVPVAMRDEVAAVRPVAWSVTSWGTPALDLGAAAVAVLASSGVRVHCVDACTMTDPRFYSYRRDTRTARATGRFCGFVRLKSPGAEFLGVS